MLQCFYTNLLACYFLMTILTLQLLLLACYLYEIKATVLHLLIYSGSLSSYTYLDNVVDYAFMYLRCFLQSMVVLGDDFLLERINFFNYRSFLSSYFPKYVYWCQSTRWFSISICNTGYKYNFCLSNSHCNTNCELHPLNFCITHGIPLQPT